MQLSHFFTATKTCPTDQHKLIPSVYAGIRIMPDGLGNKEAVSYSGSTYIAIRSGKHSSSTAMSYGLDFE